MKKLILCLFLLLITSHAWANVIQINALGGSLLNVSNPTSNYSTATSYTVLNNDAYLLRFNLSSIPSNSTITHAYMYLATNRAFQQNNNFYRMLTDFTVSQATWNVSATGVNWGASGASQVGTDYTTTNTVVGQDGIGNYNVIDIGALANDALQTGSGILDLMYRSSTSGANMIVYTPQNSTLAPYLVIITQTTGTPNTWYVRDGGAVFGTTSTTCNGTANIAFTGSNGPNCAVNNPSVVITGTGTLAGETPPLMIGGETIDIEGDSDISYAFTVSGVTTLPAVGDTYTNNGITYTVTVDLPTGASSGIITLSGSGHPTSSGDLTVVSGSGTSPIPFSSYAIGQAMYNETASLSIPSGINTTFPTIIQGIGSQYAQIWGSFSGGATLINAYLSYITLENLDLTMHDNCIKNGPIGTSVGSKNADGFLNVCGVGGTSTNSSTTGIEWGGDELRITNVLIHGFYNGLNNNINGNLPGGTIGDIILTNTKVFGNAEQGAIMGNSQPVDNVMDGTMYLINSMVDFNGCGERYPLQDTADLQNNIATAGFSNSVDDETNYYNCWGQQQNGYGDGYGFGANSSPAGNWIIIGSSTSFNTQDGVDTLHGLAGTGVAEFIRSRSEGNGGQEIKMNAESVYIENSIINGDCGRWIGAPEDSTSPGYTNQGGAQGFIYSDICRAEGDVIALPMHATTSIFIISNTINANGIAIEPGSGNSCTSATNVNIYNNIINAGSYASHDGIFMTGTPTGNEQLATFLYFDGIDGDGGGTCEPVDAGGNVILNEDYNIVYNNKNGASECHGAHDICSSTIPGYASTYKTGTVSINNGSATLTGVGTNWINSMVTEVVGFGTTDPASVTTWYVVQSVNSSTSITLASNYSGSNLSGSTYVISLPMGTPTGPSSYYYHGTQMTSYSYLTSGVASIKAGTSGLSYIFGTSDFNSYPQDNPPDLGGLQYGSSPVICTANTGSCSSNPTCCSTLCSSSNQCTACLSVGNSCFSNSNCCSGSCNSNICIGSCTTNGGSCSTGSTCCSGYCSGSVCTNAPVSVGNKNITGSFKITGMCNIQ